MATVTRTGSASTKTAAAKATAASQTATPDVAVSKATTKQTSSTAPARPSMDTTEVTAWLETGLASAFAQAFYDQGYFFVTDVDAEAVDRLVTEKGTASRLKADLARRAQGAMIPPDLPPGMSLDLSKPEMTSADGVTFKIPTALSVERTQDAIHSPGALQNADWVVIARNAALLYGFRMDGPAPVRARRPVLEWVVPERIDFARSEMFQARVESAVTYTEETAAYVRAGFDKQCATAGFPFCSASFERSHKERTASERQRKELHEVGMWKYPRATLFLDDCTRVSADFKRAVQAALEAIDPREALRQVLLDYGHAVPMEVTVGGQLHFEHVRVEEGETHERQVEQEIKAAVEAKYQGISGSASYAGGTSTSHSTASVAMAEQTNFDALGGDTTLVSNPAQWAPTVKDPRLWAVIGNARMCSPLDLLEPGLRTAAIQHWPQPQYPELPAIEEPIELPVDTAARATTAGFLLGMRECVDAASGQQGSVLLASGTQDKNQMGASAFIGEAVARAWRKGDAWQDVSGICLPVPTYGDYGVWTTSYQGKAGPPRTRLGFARTRFDFGTWRPVAVGSAETVHEDGFLAVRLSAPAGAFGGVDVVSDGDVIASSTVDQPALIAEATLCVPVRAGAEVAVRATFTVAGGALSADGVASQVHARWIPLGASWRLDPSREVEPNTHLTAETDGVLHAHLDAVTNGPRGAVRLYSSAADPWTGASVHTWLSTGQRLGRASAMLPVGKGGTYFASFTPSSGAPRLRLTWTPIVRRT